MKTLKAKICIIGSGPGGSAAFYKLATTTHNRILLCEAGPDIGSIENRKGYAVTRVPAWRALPRGIQFRPSVYQNLGGASKFYAAALFRFSPSDFTETSYGSLTSPAWPLTYDDMEPFYAEAEALFNVHGNENDDKRALVRSQPYPALGIDSERPVQAVADEMAKLGWDPFTAPIGLASFDRKKRHAIPADAQNSCLERVDRQGAEILTSTVITRLIQGKDGRIDAALGHSQGVEIRLEAEQFILACGATHTALLVQDSDLGMAGRANLVGANYMFHQHTLVPVIDDDLAPVTYAKTLAFNRFAAKTSDDPAMPYGHVQIMGAMTPELVQAYAGGWARWLMPKTLIRPFANNMIVFLVSTEDLLLTQNRIGRDKNGRITLTYRPTLEEPHRALVRRFGADLKSATHAIPDLDRYAFPIHNTWTMGLPPLNWLKHLSTFQAFKFAANAHQCGTMKMGDDPADSVVAPDGHIWGIANLYVTDASVFPSSSHFNPTLTIVANALRVATGMTL